MRPLVFSVVLLVLASLTLGAQERERAAPPAPAVPRHMLPPEGKCRIWIEGVAPAQQPAPTDCQTALRQRPPNGTVIFGRTVTERDPEAFETQPSREPPPARRATPAVKGPPRDSVRPPATPPASSPARPPVRPRRPAEKSPERP